MAIQKTALSEYQSVRVLNGSTAYGIRYNDSKTSNEFWKIDLPSGYGTFLKDVTFDKNVWTVDSFTVSPTHLSAKGGEGELHVYSIEDDSIYRVPLSGYQTVRVLNGSTAYGIRQNESETSNEFWKIDLPSGHGTFLKDVTFDKNVWTVDSFTVSPTHLSAKGGEGELHVYSIEDDSIYRVPLSGYQNVRVLNGSTAYGIRQNESETSNEFWKIDLPSGQGTLLEDVTFDQNTWDAFSFWVSPTQLSAIGGGEEQGLYVYSLYTAPGDLWLSATTFDENIAGGSIVATLSSTDSDVGDTHTYALVPGSGDVDNGAFSVDGNQLKIVGSPDFEIKSSYSVRLQTTDAGGLTFQKSVIFSVNDLDETSVGGEGVGGDGSASATPATPADSGTTGSPATPATPADPGNPGSPATPATPADSGTTGSPATSAVPATPAVPESPSSDSPVLGIQPQETVTTVELTTPLPLGNLEVTQAVVGTPQNDVITGTDVGEVLAGGSGKNQMSGGGGPDAFLFETPGEFGKKSLDIVTDFNPGGGDKLAISKEAFGGVTKVKLDVASGKKDAKKSAFSNKTFIYDEKSGVLYFNENGKKSGWGDGGEFVQLLGAPEISKADFVIA